MTVIDRSISFITEWEPDFARGLRGASPTTIAELERRMGRPCSSIYRSFLERMGEASGSVDFGELSISPARLLDERETALQYLPPGIELVGMPTGDENDDLYLVHDPAAADDAKLVRHPTLEFESSGDFDPARAEAVAGGFGEFLCLPALNRHYVLAQPHRVALTDPRENVDALARCRALAERFRLQPYWFSNDWTFVGHADGLVLIAKQAPGWFLSLGVAGPDYFAVAAVAGTIGHDLALTAYR